MKQHGHVRNSTRSSLPPYTVTLIVMTALHEHLNQFRDMRVGGQEERVKMIRVPLFGGFFSFLRLFEEIFIK